MVYNEKFVASIKCNGKILRERKNSIYLPFGTEYSIILKNLNTVSAVAEVEIDDENISKGYRFIISPNETKELKRFVMNGNLSTGPKFKFIEKTASIEEKRDSKISDGIIRIKYAFALPTKKKPIIELETHTHHYHHYHEPYYYPKTTFGSDITWTACNTSTDKVGMSANDVTRSIYHSNTGTKLSSDTGPIRTKSTSNVTFDSLSDNEPANDNGITVKGEDTNQEFTITNNIVHDGNWHSICLQLKGQTEDNTPVQAPLLVKTKVECTICSHKNKSSYKFCVECGNNLKY